MTEKNNNRKVGSVYEQRACTYLIDNGYQILATNYRNRMGEIDIIAKNKEYICFVEVKYRKNSQYGNPLEAVNYKKQMQIRKVATYYLMTQGLYEGTPIRFDVIAFLGDSMEHIENAF